MSRICTLCGKRSRVGGSIARRGLPKKKGGIGLKTTGHTKRIFSPNLQIVNAYISGIVKRIKVCTSCLKAGKVAKAI